MAEYCCLVLPFPPTVNGLYPGRGRRHKSARYKEWLDDAMRALIAQRPHPYYREPVRIIYAFGRPDKRVRDLANYLKAIDDFLGGGPKSEAGPVLVDDSLIEHLTVYWDKDVVGCRVEIEPL